MIKDAGFTLFEMLIVLALVGITAAAIPFASHTLIDRARLTWSVRSVAARVARAETQALLENVAVALTPQRLGQGLFVTVGFVASSSGGNPSTLWIYPDGSASAVQIVLHAGSMQRSLVVDPLLGSLEEGS